MISLTALTCCQLADEEEKLEEDIRFRLRLITAQQECMSQLIDKRDACAMARKHLLSGEGRN